MARTKILVIGLSRFGAAIAERLSSKGENVIVIDKEESSFKKLSDSFSGYQIVGDATQLELLEKNGIKEIKQVIITTNFDNVNIFLAHVCYYHYHVDEVLIRLMDTDKKVLIEGTTIKAVYPFELSLEKFTEITEEVAENENSNR